MKDRILIANRGEIAIRIMEACKRLGLDYVCVYTRGDEESLHVRLAQEDSGDRRRIYRVSSYRDPNDILAVADEAQATAIHPGYGFFAEDFRFARRVVKRSRPLVFIGPRWEVIRDLGNKLNTKMIARELNIPTIPGTAGPLYNELQAEAAAEEILYSLEDSGIKNPTLLVKAAAGGGGMGIEEVNNMEQFRRIWRRVRNYARRQFGDEGVLIELCLKDYHHLEVQILASRHGEYVHFGSRNCTIQSTGRQKRIEIAPGFDPEYTSYPFDARAVLDKIISDSLKLAKHVGYDNIGTWEWLVTRDGNAYLMEINTRIQVENDVSAKISRIGGRVPNLVEEQIRLALGDKMGYAQEDITFEGTSIEFRLIAEDTKRGFIPSAGVITRFAYPDYDWLTIYSHVPRDRPYRIPTEYDPNLALAVIWGKDTTEAKARGRTFLAETTIEGQDSHGQPLLTNITYLKERLEEILIFS
ncbi:acetyl-CoA carboxylase biotin carboxylase subunit [Thermosulfuriphilus ammonigenes]|uniref:biotin carboxylase n=1 Tax=Thermosulfuriphilus ammonigenes TaxID=1936021 RepID=A0A6G7PTM1_9BACT|nr:acetyl-CoA carboxylase biotin carboxylase subunit family protein [Thermosulfuriphilus ammonigenes]MBA2848949.1 acetyl/propionyl-CoA carboxylase alpha subunit [Thermosulfuriphilus ammonigenes]QIJ70937.1 acetyl-CoA carboxylase biotin carboxylase subunit [Thermosulfuriphilus ammonigenes]